MTRVGIRQSALVALLIAGCARAPTLPETIQTGSPVSVPERQMTMETIEKELWQDDDTREFRISTLRERHIVSDILAALLSHAEAGNANLAALARKASTVAFRIEVWHVDEGVFWALLEMPRHRRGAGAYIVRVAPRDRERMRVVLQSPHAYYDLGTNVIGARLFFGSDSIARAFYTNTVHRYWDGTGENKAKKYSPADVCHRADHVFQYATDATARVFDEVTVVQLHGFSDKKHRPDAIVSAGDTSGSTPIIEEMVGALSDTLGDTKRFPEETEQLGGTNNAQGRMLRSFRRAHFVHLELSKSTRKKLLSSDESLKRLGLSLSWPSRKSAIQQRGKH